MGKYGFYLMGKKGFEVLQSIMNKPFVDEIKFVVFGKDKSIDNDFSVEIEELCNSNNIKCVDRRSLPSQFVNNSAFTFAIGWRWMIRSETNLIVLHDSLLPKYRGFAPLVNMLLNGEKEIGVTALFASEEYDKGDVIDCSSMSITYPIKIKDAIDKVSTLYVDLIHKVLERIEHNEPIYGIKQNEDDATYSIWRDVKDYKINWKSNSEYIERFINSVSSPYAGAYTFVGNRKIIILDVEQYCDVKIESRSEHIGKCIFMKNNEPVIICSTGLLQIKNAFFSDNGLPIEESLTFRTRLT
jgi:methionyl-tRNA formyltransferase